MLKSGNKWFSNSSSDDYIILTDYTITGWSQRACSVVPSDFFRSELSRDMTKPTKWLCAQRRFRSAWASAQSDQSLRCALSGSLRTQGFFMRTAKTLIRLGGCPGWSKSSLGAHATLFVLSCGGSFSTCFVSGPTVNTGCFGTTRRRNLVASTDAS